ncbi:MAG: ImmA/IrrE family metallo-endopeptidase [Rhodospirillaceae bacterium]|nr:ImmA/IrrE family metallo-endopeptidase [Rhodospirillaceae bacterium]MYI49032.1 ImmA/IrrE family metallo-endopeptidase [Rhodospirillaceae bacterium]
MTEPMPIVPAVLTWARERAGYSQEAAAAKFSKIAGWERGETAPTYPQLEKLAECFKVPVAVFFFPEPPDLPSIEQSFRTLGSEQFAAIPPRIRLLIRKARAFQMGLEDLNRGRSQAPRLITRDLSFDPTDDPIALAEELRNYFRISLSDQMQWSSPTTALQEWRKALIQVGVHVFKDQFRNSSYSGFCLYSSEFPLIYVNNSMAKTRQIFTFFHELSHLLFQTSGVDPVDDEYFTALSPHALHIETICNRLAAQFLVPDSEFDKCISGQKIDEDLALTLANSFCVSRELIYRKLLDRHLISVNTYRSAASRWNKQVKTGSGGDYYHTIISYLGVDYINLAFRRYYQNMIDDDELADYLDVKPKNLTKLEEYITRRAP